MKKLHHRPHGGISCSWTKCIGVFGIVLFLVAQILLVKERALPLLDLGKHAFPDIQLQPPPSFALQNKGSGGSISTTTLAEAYLPILPAASQLSDKDYDAVGRAALQEFFQRYPDKTRGGLIDFGQFGKGDIGQLRNLARKIMGADTTCGDPKVLGKSVTHNQGMEYCFWENDLVVSKNAMNDFAWERSEWSWVVESFRDETLVDVACLAFMDVGVNVGDWAAPILALLPNVTYLGVEGMPSTAAVAAANMLTSIESQRKVGRAAAPAVLLPFHLLGWRSLQQARDDGGVCYLLNHGNIGGSYVQKSTKDMTNKKTTAKKAYCPPKSIAGATFFSHALQHMADIQSSSSLSCKRLVWPSVYIAKMDIQGFEHTALVSSMDWMQQRPPCYLMLEFTNGESQNVALLALLLDLGYDAMWRNVDHLNEKYERPPDAPHWTPAMSETLFDVYEKDMRGKVTSYYMNYVFGFQDRTSCIKRLVT